MGLVKAAMNAASGVMADQWKEFFYCDALPAEVLAVKGQKRTDRRTANKHGNENIISDGKGAVQCDLALLREVDTFVTEAADVVRIEHDLLNGEIGRQLRVLRFGFWLAGVDGVYLAAVGAVYGAHPLAAFGNKGFKTAAAGKFQFFYIRHGGTISFDKAASCSIITKSRTVRKDGIF